MKKVLAKALLVGLFFSVFLYPLAGHATEISTPVADPCYSNIRVYVNKVEAMADGADTITFTVSWKQNPPADGVAGCFGGGPLVDYVTIFASGSGNTFTKTQLNATTNLEYYLANHEVVYETTALKSATAEVKNISVAAHWDLGITDPAVSTGHVTYIPPVSTVETTTNSTSTAVKLAAVATQEQESTQSKPEAPILNKLRVNNDEYKGLQLEANNKFNYGNKITFSGTSIPKSIVHLYFHSDPFEDTAVADEEGNWVYVLEEDIGLGDHELQIAVTDPATDLTSDKSEAIKFSIVEEASTDNTANILNDSDTSHFWWYIAGSLFFVIVLVIFIYFGVVKHKIFHRNQASKKIS